MKLLALQSVKFLRLKRKLGLPHYATVGVLESLWLFAQTNARDGDLTRYSADDIAAALEWAGPGEDLVLALVDSGWLDRGPEGLKIHDWEEHSPRWVRGVLARQKARNEALTELGTECDTELVTQLVTQLRTEFGTECRTTKTKTKTKTKNKNKSGKLSLSPRPRKIEAGATVEIPPENAILVFPAVGSGPSFWALTPEILEEFQGFFPAIDCVSECRKALAWVSADGARRKTARGYRRFLTAWLTRSSDSRRTDSQPKQSQSEKLNQALRSDHENFSASISRPQFSPTMPQIESDRALPQVFMKSPNLAIFGGYQNGMG